MKKKEILSQLEKDIYCELKPSKIAGVGVFAIRDIPKGISPLREKDTKYLPIREEELVDVEDSVKKHIRKLFVYSEGCFWLPEQGIQTLCITHYLNHSNNPNLITSSDADNFFAVRDIKEGEELTVNYDLFDGAGENFRK